MKDGWKTSEFWVTLIVQITGILVLTGVIDPAQSTATKKKRTSKGTQQFNRNLKISNVSI